MIRVAKGTLPADCHPKVSRIVDYWRSIHPAEGLPGRHHLDPTEIPTLLPNICLIDVPAGTNRFTFRLMGTEMVHFFGADLTGQAVAAGYQKAEESLAYKDLCNAREDHLMRWRYGPATFVRNREHVITERVFLPLAGDGENVDMFIGLIIAMRSKGNSP